MTFAIAQAVKNMQANAQRLDALIAHLEDLPPTVSVVQIGGIGCYLGEKGQTIGGVFGMTNAKLYSPLQAANACANLRNADGSKSTAGKVLPALDAAREDYASLLTTIATLLGSQVA